MITQMLGQGPADIERAAAILRGGGLVALPTETVYGLAANAFDEEAVKRIFSAKGRPQDNPLIVHICDIDELHKLCPVIPAWIAPVMERFWPGPLTILLEKGDLVPQKVTCGLFSIAVRFPAHPVARAVIRAAGVPLAAPSANLSGRPSPTTAAHVWEDLNGRIDAVIDGGECRVGIESTVLDLRARPPRLLRPGGVTLEEIREVLPDVIVDQAVYRTLKEEEAPSSPGMKYRHYAPRAPVVIVRGEEERVLSYILAHAKEGCGVLCYDENRELFPGRAVLTYGRKADIKSLAKNLFDRLRRFDKLGVSMIYAQCPGEEGIGLAVCNRLNKAAGFHIIDV